MPTGFLGDTSIRLSNSTETFYKIVEDYSPDEELFLYSYLASPGTQICRGFNPRVVGTTSSYVVFRISNGSMIRCTKDQRFLTTNYEFIRACDLSKGVKLLGIYFKDVSNGVLTSIIDFDVTDIWYKESDTSLDVYNMTVNLCYDYVITNNSDPTTGILAHDN